MNKLNGLSCYLAGPVEFDQNAHDWRNTLSERLIKFNLKIYNPLIKPKWLNDACKVDPQVYIKVLNGNSQIVNSPSGEMLLTKDVVEVAAKELRRLCMKMVTSSDFVICNAPRKYTSGTWDEIYFANDADIPVLFCAPDGIPATWMISRFPSSAFFKNWDELMNYIENVDNGTIDVDLFQWLPAHYFGEI